MPTPWLNKMCVDLSEERDAAQVPQIKGKAKELRSRAERLKRWRIRTQEFEEKMFGATG